MRLEVKRPEVIVPEYSLTGDLLSYRRCARQYRYYNGSSLPPSRPVQLWYGEFIHAVLESAYRLWKASEQTPLAFPWPYTALPERGRIEPPPAGLPLNDIRVIGWPVEDALLRENKRARSGRARRAAYMRAEATVNMLGPHLFPLVAAAEQKVIGTRPLPPQETPEAVRADRYALHGVIDVLTNLTLDNVESDNIIKVAVRSACPDAAGAYEVIVDYKGSRRPPVGSADWNLGAWQVRTYAWLRSRQQEALPVVAGILLYINELAPRSRDIAWLKRELGDSTVTTDVRPVEGSHDAYELSLWRPGSIPALSPAFRLARALRVIPVDAATIEEATTEFDNTVAQIESNVASEAACGRIRETWNAHADPNTCAACDFRYSCEGSRASEGDIDEGETEDDI